MQVQLTQAIVCEERRKERRERDESENERGEKERERERESAPQQAVVRAVRSRSAVTGAEQERKREKAPTKGAGGGTATEQRAEGEAREALSLLFFSLLSPFSRSPFLRPFFRIHQTLPFPPSPVLCSTLQTDGNACVRLCPSLSTLSHGSPRALLPLAHGLAV